MKNVTKIFFLFLILIPFFVLAKSDPFNDVTINKVNNYIKSDRYKNRDKYLIFKNPNYYKFNSNTIGFDNRFVTGGLLNKDEFELSIRDNNSYLVTGIEYWTMTEVNRDSEYYIENYLKYKDKIKNSNVRVTQIIKNEVEVTGNGSYVNPWVFSERPLVTIRTNSKDYGKIDNQVVSSRYAIEVSGAKNKYYVDFNIQPSPGYEYEGHDGCGLVNTNTVDGANTYSNIYRINNVIDDMDCTAVFIPRTWKLTLKSNEGYSKEPVPNIIYYKYRDGWYSNNNFTNNFNVLTTLPTRAGYSFEGYKFGSTEVIDKNGNLKIDKNTTIFNDTKSDNINLIAQWSACPAGYYASASDPVCKICPAGTYSKGAAPSCTPCPAGQYQPNEGKDTCILCPKGQYQNDQGKTKCEKCNTNTYQDKEGQINCKNCSDGYHSGIEAYSCTPNTFTVAYNANGGSGSTSSHSCTFDSACTLKSNEFTRQGYEFIGWKRDNSGSTLSAGSSIKNVVTSGTVTYYAQWKESVATAYSNGKFSIGFGVEVRQGSNYNHCNDSSCSYNSNTFVTLGSSNLEMSVGNSNGYALLHFDYNVTDYKSVVMEYSDSHIEATKQCIRAGLVVYDDNHGSVIASSFKAHNYSGENSFALKYGTKNTCKGGTIFTGSGYVEASLEGITGNQVIILYVPSGRVNRNYFKITKVYFRK